MATYTETLARILHRPAILHPPTAIVRALAGEMAEEMLLKSARVVPEKLQQTGYGFGYETLEAGLRHVLGRARPVVPA